MDVLKGSLTTMFMRGLVTRLIRKKLGCDVDLKVNDVHVSTSDGKVRLRLDAEAEITQADLMKIINKKLT